MDGRLVLRPVLNHGPLLPSTGPQWTPAISMGVTPQCGFHGYCGSPTAYHYGVGLHVRPTILSCTESLEFRINIANWELCRPIKAMWAFPPIWNGRCLDVSTAMLSGACLNTISEFIVASLPIAVVFHLRMTKRQRWIVISMLSLGFFVTIVGAARTYFLWRAIVSYDQAWWAMPHWVCSEVEIDTALVRVVLRYAYES